MTIPFYPFYPEVRLALSRVRVGKLTQTEGNEGKRVKARRRSIARTRTLRRTRGVTLTHARQVGAYPVARTNPAAVSFRVHPLSASRRSGFATVWSVYLRYLLRYSLFDTGRDRKSVA